jgi:hypothetical protein
MDFSIDTNCRIPIETPNCYSPYMSVLFRKKFLPLFRDEEILPLIEIFYLGKSCENRGARHDLIRLTSLCIGNII